MFRVSCFVFFVILMFPYERVNCFSALPLLPIIILKQSRANSTHIAAKTFHIIIIIPKLLVKKLLLTAMTHA